MDTEGCKGLVAFAYNRVPVRSRAAILAALCAACVSIGPDLGEDEISVRDLWLPEGARAGMFMTWRHLGDDGEETVVEETIACVRESAGYVTMEWRETRRDGKTEVVAAHIRRDGTVLSAWRGPVHGMGHPLKIVIDAEFDPQEVEAEVNRFGYSTKDANVSSSRDREIIETPAGRFKCIRSRTRVSILIASGTFTSWHAEVPLPLSQLVKIEMDWPFGSRTTELIAYGTTGAKPTLKITER